MFAQDGETAIKKSFEVESKVFVFKVEEGALMEITPFPFKKRISQVSYNQNGKLFCQIVESSREMPTLFVYDVKKSFPLFDRHWAHENRVRNENFELGKLEI